MLREIQRDSNIRFDAKVRNGSLFVVIVVFLLAILPGVVRSEPVGDKVGGDNRPGAYVGAGGGRFNFKLQSLDDAGVAANSIEHSDNLAWTVFAGYRFTPHWSLEGAYIDFGEPNASYLAAGGTASGNYRVMINGVSPNVVGTLPMGPIELFAKVGYYLYRIQTRLNVPSGFLYESSATGADLLYSAGIGMHLIRRLSAHVEYERLNITNARDSDSLWLTAQWRF